MQQVSTINVVEAGRVGLYAYYRVIVDGDEVPSLVFVTAPYKGAQEQTALREWCRRNLGRLDSGTVIEAVL